MFLRRSLISNSFLIQRHISRSMSTKVLSFEEGNARLQAAYDESVRNNGNHVFSFYSSVLGGIATDPRLLTVPVDSHLVHRGHGVFDTANIKNGKVYGLDFHLDRFFKSANKARINLNDAKFLDNITNEKEQKQKMKQIILDTIAASGQKDGIFCRYWLSACRGDFSITPKNCTSGPNLYVVVHQRGGDTDGPPSVKESTVTIPLKGELLATMKSTNYLINALCAMEAQDKTDSGSSLGLQVDAEGHVAEFAIGSVAIVGKDQILRSPFQHKILASTTLNRAFELVKEKLVPQGVLKGCEFANITLDQVFEAEEVIELGGGTARAVTHLDDKIIKDGKPGPVFKQLYQILDDDQEHHVHTDDIPN